MLSSVEQAWEATISHACGISWASCTTQNIDCTKIPMTYPSQITYSDLLKPFRKLLFARPSQCSVGLSCKGNTNPVITDIILLRYIQEQSKMRSKIIIAIFYTGIHSVNYQVMRNTGIFNSWWQDWMQCSYSELHLDPGCMGKSFRGGILSFTWSSPLACAKPLILLWGPNTWPCKATKKKKLHV